MNKADRNVILCFCCHCVRGCKHCCKTCKCRCNQAHQCEHDMWDECGDTTAEAWVWYHSVSTTMNSDFALSHIPDGIKRRVEKLTRKPIQLDLFD